MNKMITIGTVGLASLVSTGLMTFQAQTAFAGQGSDDRQQAFKRDDDTPDVVMTVDDNDDDDTGLGQRDTNTGTGTGTNTNGGTSTGVSRDRDNSRGNHVRDLTNDGPGRNNVDHSRHQTNDGTRHDTRG
jgi:hypothetical protein